MDMPGMVTSSRMVISLGTGADDDVVVVVCGFCGGNDGSVNSESGGGTNESGTAFCNVGTSVGDGGGGSGANDLVAAGRFGGSGGGRGNATTGLASLSETGL